MESNYLELLDPGNEHLKLTHSQTKERIRLNPSRYFYISSNGVLINVTDENLIRSKIIWERSECFYQAIIDIYDGQQSNYIDQLIELASRDKKRYENAKEEKFKLEEGLANPFVTNSFRARIASNVSPIKTPNPALYGQDGIWSYSTMTSEIVEGGSDLGIDNDLLMLL